MSSKYVNDYSEKHKLQKKYENICKNILLKISDRSGIKISVLKSKVRIIEVNYARFSYYKFCKLKYPEIPDWIIASVVNRDLQYLSKARRKMEYEVDLIQYYKSLKLE